MNYNVILPLENTFASNFSLTLKASAITLTKQKPECVNNTTSMLCGIQLVSKIFYVMFCYMYSVIYVRKFKDRYLK